MDSWVFNQRLAGLLGSGLLRAHVVPGPGLGCGTQLPWQVHEVPESGGSHQVQCTSSAGRETKSGLITYSHTSPHTTDASSVFSPIRHECLKHSISLFNLMSQSPSAWLSVGYREKVQSLLVT